MTKPTQSYSIDVSGHKRIMVVSGNNEKAARLLEKNGWILAGSETDSHGTLYTYWKPANDETNTD